MVVNQAGQDSANVTLYVRPLIVDQPQDQFTRQGESVTLSCRADSFPSPLYQWEKYNTTSESYYQLPGETNRTLVFSSVEFDDFGDYHCVATTPVIGDTDTSDNATITGECVCSGVATQYNLSLLTVSPEGSVTATPTVINANRTQQAVFICLGEGCPDSMFQWVLTRDGSTASNTAELSLTSTAMIGGEYQCTVFSLAGNESRSVTLNGTE